MRCQECRSRLNPYLDDELGVDENVAVLEHLDACPPCRELFEAEQRCWAHVRTRLRAGGAPATLCDALSGRLAAIDRARLVRRLSFVAAPLAAAALMAAVLFDGRGTPHVDEPPPARHDHGPAVYSAFLDLEEVRTGGTITADFLRVNGQDLQKLRGDELRAFFVKLFGPDAHVPDALYCGESWGVPRNASFKGTPVSNLILDVQDQDVFVYRVSREEARLANLELVEEGVTEGIRIERCPQCRVVAVTRGDDVFILVTKDGGVDPLVALMRQTF